jgi:hypothetical protein
VIYYISPTKKKGFDSVSIPIEETGWIKGFVCAAILGFISEYVLDKENKNNDYLMKEQYRAAVLKFCTTVATKLFSVYGEELRSFIECFQSKTSQTTKKALTVDDFKIGDKFKPSFNCATKYLCVDIGSKSIVAINLTTDLTEADSDCPIEEVLKDYSDYELITFSISDLQEAVIVPIEIKEEEPVLTLKNINDFKIGDKFSPNIDSATEYLCVDIGSKSIIAIELTNNLTLKWNINYALDEVLKDYSDYELTILSINDLQDAVIITQ